MLALAEDISEDGEVTFGVFNLVSSECIAYSALRIAELYSGDSTLFFSESDMVVWTSYTVSSVLSVLDLFNDLLYIYHYTFIYENMDQMTNIFNTMVVQRMDKTHSRIGKSGSLILRIRISGDDGDQGSG